MIVIGLTGGIASGKTVIASRFSAHGIPVLDADRIAHNAIAPGGIAEAEVADAFPDALEDGIISRSRLGALVFSDDTKLHRLESILHPRVREAEERTIAALRASKKAKAVVVEIPLLFEVGADALCDDTIAASAPEPVRIARALAREHMTEAKLEFILAKQWRDEERNARAGHVIATGGTLEDTYAQVDALIAHWGLLS